VINVDETWINEKDYRRRCWRKREKANSMAVKAISPNISLLLAIDTDGDIFYSLTQVNTDWKVKSLFLTKLCEALDSDRPDWRETSVMMMDNAPYNKKDECIDHIKSLNIPMVFISPYSFDASPVELFFSYLKQGTIVDPNVPTGKL
jgi:hypothetical protein